MTLRPDREPAWPWLLAGLLAALARAETRAAPPPPVPRAALERWAARDDPARMAARDLRRLPGVGDAKAAAAAETRWRAGARGSAAGAPLSWTAVPGIGERTAAKIDAWLAERGRAGADLSGGLSGAGEDLQRGGSDG